MLSMYIMITFVVGSLYLHIVYLDCFSLILSLLSTPHPPLIYKNKAFVNSPFFLFLLFPLPHSPSHLNICFLILSVYYTFWSFFTL